MDGGGCERGVSFDSGGGRSAAPLKRLLEPAYGGMLLLNGVTFWMYLQVPLSLLLFITLGLELSDANVSEP